MGACTCKPTPERAPFDPDQVLLGRESPSCGQEKALAECEPTLAVPLVASVSALAGLSGQPEAKVASPSEQLTAAASAPDAETEAVTEGQTRAVGDEALPLSATSTMEPSLEAAADELDGSEEALSWQGLARVPGAVRTLQVTASGGANELPAASLLHELREEPLVMPASPAQPRASSGRPSPPPDRAVQEVVRRMAYAAAATRETDGDLPSPAPLQFQEVLDLWRTRLSAEAETVPIAAVAKDQCASKAAGTFPPEEGVKASTKHPEAAAEDRGEAKKQQEEAGANTITKHAAAETCCDPEANPPDMSMPTLLTSKPVAKATPDAEKKPGAHTEDYPYSVSGPYATKQWALKDAAAAPRKPAAKHRGKSMPSFSRESTERPLPASAEHGSAEVADAAVATKEAVDAAAGPKEAAGEDAAAAPRKAAAKHRGKSMPSFSRESSRGALQDGAEDGGAEGLLAAPLLLDAPKGPWRRPRPSPTPRRQSKEHLQRRPWRP